MYCIQMAQGLMSDKFERGNESLGTVKKGKDILVFL
jgi:hypothetical protein